MKIDNKKIIVLLFLFFFRSAISLPVNYTPITESLPPLEIAHMLGWAPCHGLICGGYFQEPPIVSAYPHPPEISATATTITADETVSFSVVGTSSLSGNVTITQPGRKITADKATLYRDKTGQITHIWLEGNVHFMEAGKHIVACRLYVDLQNKYARLEGILYRLSKRNKLDQELNAWGSASLAQRLTNGVLQLDNGTYTTCSPTSITWQVVASQIRVDQEAGRGDAYNSRLYIHNVPVLWLPYYSFPTDKRRKTGFLFPTVGYTDRFGLDVGIPFYFNLAPNYDLTIITDLISQRDVLFESQFRYLSACSAGDLNIAIVPYDKVFAQFRSTAASTYGVNDQTIPFLNRIENASNTRGYITFHDGTNFNSHLWGSLNINYVSDDYYLQDFAKNPFTSINDQLLNQAELNFANDNWRVLGKLLTFQTLHPINQQPIRDQYSRLPQIYFTSDYPIAPNRLDLQLNGEYVYFSKRKQFLTHAIEPTGNRFHLQPYVSFPLIQEAGFVIPKLQLDMTYYDLNDRKPGEPESIGRVLPIFNIDSGIYFQKEFSKYVHTFEPRLFYLYVPYYNQNDIPLFDTTLPAFSVAQLFRTNRFIGYDRIGDANQVSLAVSSRILDGYTGYQLFKASVGEIFYLQQPKVCLTPDCFNEFQVNNNLSPLVGEISYNLTPNWETVANVAFNPEDWGLNNASVEFHYHPSPKHLFTFGYDFVRKGDELTTYALDSVRKNLNRIDLAGAWQLNDHWQLLGNWNYNLSHGHPQAYFYGFQYDSCCWAFRVVLSRIITAESVNDVATFQNNYYVQFQLKGLGNVGNSDAGSLLTSSIFGYVDTFRG